MPFKANADRRHHIPRQRHRATNSADYDAALPQRGSLTVWFTDAAIAAWQAEPRTTRGGQQHYSDLAIATALTLRAVFRLALRQTEGLIDFNIDLLGLDLAVPDHTTLSRRAWRTLHIGTDADTGHIAAATLTGSDACDASQVGPLLDQIAGPVASVTANRAYDQDGVYDEVATRHPDAALVVPPRSNAVPSDTAETAPTPRDRHLQPIAERGRMGWQTASGYNWRALVESDVSRFKRVIGGRPDRHGIPRS